MKETAAEREYLKHRERQIRYEVAAALSSLLSKRSIMYQKMAGRYTYELEEEVHTMLKYNSSDLEA